MTSSINKNVLSAFNTTPIEQTETTTQSTTNGFISHLVKKIKNVCNTLHTTPIKTIQTANKSTANKFISHLVKKLKSVYNLIKNTVVGTKTKKSKSNDNFKRQQPINMKLFINKQIYELDIYSNGINDNTYADQTIDSVLSSIYSEQKDSFCINQTKTMNKIPSGYLKEIGEIAKQHGLVGKENKGIFEPSGAGANPFLTAVMSPVIKRFGVTIERMEDTRFYDYAKQKIHNEVAKLCLAKGRIDPNSFNSQLSEIAKKYLQN